MLQATVYTGAIHTYIIYARLYRYILVITRCYRCYRYNTVYYTRALVSTRILVYYKRSAIFLIKSYKSYSYGSATVDYEYTDTQIQYIQYSTL